MTDPYPQEPDGPHFPGDAPDRLDALLDRELKGLARETFPTDRLSFVLTTARRDARRDAWSRFVAWLRAMPAADLRPAFAMAALTVITVTAALWGHPGRNRPPVDPAVAEALDQVRWTLGFLSGVSERTGASVRDDILAPHVVQPLQDAATLVFQEPATLN